MATLIILVGFLIFKGSVNEKVQKVPIKESASAEARFDSSQSAIITPATINTLPNFSFQTRGTLIEKYGELPSMTFSKNPEILAKVQLLDPKLTKESLGLPSVNRIFDVNETEKVLVLRGCLESSCTGTLKVVSINLSNKKVNLLSENGASLTIPNQEVTIYGNPNEQTKKILLFAYLNP